MKNVVIGALSIAMGMAGPLHAQSFFSDPSALAGYAALNASALGLLPSGPATVLFGADDRATGLFARYGNISSGVNAIGAGVELGGGHNRFTIIAGTTFCSDCEGHLVMIGAGWQNRFYSSSTVTTGTSPIVNVGFDGEIAATVPTKGSGNIFGASVRIPVLLVVGAATTTRFAPYLAPGIGGGIISGGGDSQTGFRVQLGGGIAMLTDGGFGANIGVNKVFLDGGSAVVSLGLSFGAGKK